MRHRDEEWLARSLAERETDEIVRRTKMAKKTKGKGVDALFAEEQAAKAKGEAKRERDARKKGRK